MPAPPSRPADQPLGARVELDGHAVLCGSCSWTDKTLVQETDWYPQRTMSAKERLEFYAAHFPLTEIDSTYYAPPAEEQARLWAERTPDGFRFDVKAYALLTGHPTKPQSLWKDLRDGLPDGVREKRTLYAHHLDPEQLSEAWRRASERDRDRTLALLRDQGLTYVCVDAPPVSELPRLPEVTTPELFVMRLHGRADDKWQGRTRTAAERFRYLYSRDELDELARDITTAAREARESHLLTNNCYRDYGVRNAAELRDILAEAH